MKTNELMCELIDPATKIRRMTVVKVSGGQISIHIKGFGDNTSGDDYGEPIVIDLHDNKLQVFLWSDINDENHTHKIDMTGARVDKRVEKDSDGNCIYCGQKCHDGEMCDEQQAGGFNHNKAMETQDDA